MFDFQTVNWLSSSSTFKCCSALDKTVLMPNGSNNEIPPKVPKTVIFREHVFLHAHPYFHKINTVEYKRKLAVYVGQIRQYSICSRDVDHVFLLTSRTFWIMFQAAIFLGSILPQHMALSVTHVYFVCQKIF